MPDPLIRPRLHRPWLTADFGAPCRILSFAPWRPGYQMAARVQWREVRNADLTPELDAHSWFAGELAQAGMAADVGLLTSRDIGRHHLAEVEVDGIRAACLATVGLGNAERIGARRHAPGPGYGTINLAVRLAVGLSDTALLEALSLAAEARTAAVMAAGLALVTGIATGTGTDCIAVAADPGDGAYAGKHTAVGEALGAAVFAAVAAGAEDWMREQGMR